MSNWSRPMIAVMAAFWLAMTLAMDSVPSVAEAATGSPQRLTALVIGNAKYPDQPLRNPVHDARAMSAALKARGFDVTLVTDANLVKMQKAILKFGEKLSGGGVGLFYYAGHGLQVRGNNYIVPIDENIRSEASVRFEAISLDAVIEEMSQPRPNRINIVILDACRNNPFKSRYGGSGAGLALIDAPANFLVAYATAPGAVAVDGNTKNGLYTGSLIKAMQLPGLKIEDVFKKVRAMVSRKTRAAQIPWEASSLVQDFSFTVKSPSPPPETVVAQKSTVQSAEPRGIRGSRQLRDAELAFWDSIKSSKNAADYEAYLEAFPKGVFAPLARARVERYKGGPGVEQKPASPDIEEIEEYYKTKVTSNIRENPTARSKKVGSVSEGTRILGTGKVKNSNWYRVRTDEGVVGFIYGELLAKAEGPGIEKKPAGRAETPRPSAPQKSERSALVYVPSAPPPQPKPQVRPSSRPPKPTPSPRVEPPKPSTARVEPPKAATPRVVPEKPSPPPRPAVAASRPSKPRPPREPDDKPTESAFLARPPVEKPEGAKTKAFQDCPGCPKMVSVRPGTFSMGNRGGDPSERPAHRVRIQRRFAIGMYEVTWGEWMACVRAKGCDFTPRMKGASDRDPVRNLSWVDTQEYIRWLRKVTGKPYRLPTEAEWEYAARGNTSTSYWWGNAVGVGKANCKGCGGAWNRQAPAKAGSHGPNPFGLYDMNGGVWEWVSDCWRSSYDGAPTDGSSWDRPNCARYVLRGGSWRNDASYVLSSSRFFYDRGVRYLTNGFRVALTLN